MSTDAGEAVRSELGLRSVRPFGEPVDGRFLCRAPVAWLARLVRRRRLRPASSDPEEPHLEVLIQVYPKRPGERVLPLPEPRAHPANRDRSRSEPMTRSQLLRYVARANTDNLRRPADAEPPAGVVGLVDRDEALADAIDRLYGCAPVRSASPELAGEGRRRRARREAHPNTLAAICAVETPTAFHVVHHAPRRTTLRDCVTFCPALLERDRAVRALLAYQLLQTFEAAHDRGLSVGDLRLRDVHLSDDLWIQTLPRSLADVSAAPPDRVLLRDEADRAPRDVGRECGDRETDVACEKLCDLWVAGRLSNLDYLLRLNALAGRKSGDPRAHPVVPWVTDFASRRGDRRRDLTKSKYRLTKGDGQLDATYDTEDADESSRAPDRTPHHVSDVLSEITYYVYAARRTPKEVLRQHVRQNWVPAEYPSSIQRMQEWSPDECVPEFFTDPSIFKSIHEDLPDLGIPTWASCVEDFIVKHREALESSHVSESLHHWIDLTFGFKLSGAAAVKAKNVCLSLVDGHVDLGRTGPVQLFTCPHPVRLSSRACGRGEKIPPRIIWHDGKKTQKQINQSDDDLSDEDNNVVPPPATSSTTHSILFERESRLDYKRNVSCERRLPRKRDVFTNSTPTEIAFNSADVQSDSDAHSSNQSTKSQKADPGKDVIYLPKEFNPVYRLTAIENMLNFKMKTFYSNEIYNSSDPESTKPFSQITESCRPNTNENSEKDDKFEINSFTNQMFEQNFKRYKRSETNDHSTTKEENSVRYYVTMAYFKETVLLNRKRDMQVMGCLLVELFLYQKLRPLLLDSSRDFDERYRKCRLVLKNNLSSLPTCIRNVACLLLQINPNNNTHLHTPPIDDLNLAAKDVAYPCISDIGLPPPTPMQLLQPILSNHLLYFPKSFSSFYVLLVTLHEYSITEKDLHVLFPLECESQDNSKSHSFDKKRFYFIRKIAESKVHSCSTFLETYIAQESSFNQYNIIDLFFPYFVKLLQNKDTCILAAWYLFDPVAKALGPIETNKRLLKLMLSLYDEQIIEKSSDSDIVVYSNRKSVKLYHHIFLLRLIVRFGLQSFLENFTSHLIEAVGGYKDISCTDLSLPSHLNNIDIKFQNSIKILNYCDDNLKNTLNTPHEILSPDTSCGSENVLTPLAEKGSLSNNKMKLGVMDPALETDIFHFENECNKESPKTSHKVDDAKSCDFNKIKRLLEEIDLECNSPTLESYFDHTQGVEATESTCVSENNSDARLSQFVSYPSVTLTNACHNKETSDVSKLQLKSPSINARASCNTFTSYVHHFNEVPQSLVEGPPAIQSDRDSKHSKEKCEANCENSLNSESKEYKISEMASESLIWLAHRLGPVLACKHITRNLLKMLTLCYIGQENLQPSNETSLKGLDLLCIANGRLCGDRNASKVIECLTSIVELYGEQLILLQYFPHMGDLIASCRKRISTPLEGGLIACLQLLRYLIPCLSDVKLMEQLQDIILKNILHPTLRLISSTRTTFPGGIVARTALVKKFLETLYILAVRIGGEMTRKHLCVPALQRFCLTFDKVHGVESDYNRVEVEPNIGSQRDSADNTESQISLNDDGGTFLEICRDGTTAEWRVKGGLVICEEVVESSPSHSHLPDKAFFNSAMEELKAVFTNELAFQTFSWFTKLIGEDTMCRNIKNFSLIKGLSKKHEGYIHNREHTDVSDVIEETSFCEAVGDFDNKRHSDFYTNNSSLGRSQSIPCKRVSNTEENSNANSFGSNVAVVGNRIDVQADPNEECVFTSIYSHGDALDIVSCKSENAIKSNRHLRGDWLIYWEHEVGRPDKDNNFNLKQIKLQTFSGHTHSVRSIICMDNENSFMTGSKDKTVKLWSLRNQGDGTALTSCQWTYSGHRKGILSMSFLESQRLAVSTDSVVHIWDPYVENVIAQLDNPKMAPVSMVKALAAPSNLILAATTDTVIKVIDAKTCSYTHELKVTLNTNTCIRCICVSPSGKWIAVGLATGHLSLLDARTGTLLAHWKGHEGEILQLVTINESTIVSSSLDQTVSAWSTSDGKLKMQLKGLTEPVHCLAVHRDELLSGTTNNRIGVHSSVDREAPFSSAKLKSDTFRGVLTSMCVLPLNRILLLGSESGNVVLLC